MTESVLTAWITGTVVCTLLLIFKNRILSALGGRWLYRIGLVAMLLFLIPMNFSGIRELVPTSQMPAVPAVTAPVPSEVTVNEAATEPPKVSQVQEENASPVLAEIPAEHRSLPITVKETVFLIWLLGCVGSFGWYAISYLRFQRKICGFEVYEKIGRVTVIQSPLVHSPLIFGFFKPTLAIPQTEMDAADYRLALRHEMTHFQHHDSWYKLFAVAVNAVQWFNPIAYLMVRFVGEACEYACDETVVQCMDASEKKQYSEMILSVICQNSPALSSNMAKSKKQLKRRFAMIMKKKRFHKLKATVCVFGLLILTCTGVAFANEAAPRVASLLKDDTVYVTNFGTEEYLNFIPTERNGVYYLPLREFLNGCDMEDDTIRYDDGKITVDVWSDTVTLGGTQLLVNGERVTRDAEEVYPAKHVWSSSLQIGNKTVVIGDTEAELENAPYIEDGVTYVPYEYFRMLRRYENLLEGNTWNDWTHKFSSMMMYGFDRLESSYYCDDVEIDALPKSEEWVQNENGDWLTLSWGSDALDAETEIKKSGFRTEFHSAFTFADWNNHDNGGTAELTLNKVTRIYSKGSDLEGLFTLTVDGQTVYENEVGYINNLPIPSGDGIVYHAETTVAVGKVKLRYYFKGFNPTEDAVYNQLTVKNNEIYRLEDTQKQNLLPTAVKLNGNTVSRTAKDSYFFRNPKENYGSLKLRFDDASGEDVKNITSYEISTEGNDYVKEVVDGTYTGHFFLKRNQVRIDSFDASITVLADGQFTFASDDGRYLVQGSTADYIPQWQWSEEERNAIPPSVTMITE